VLMEPPGPRWQGFAMARPMSTRRALKDKLMVKAREIASSGSCAGWGDVVRKFEGDEEATFRIWMTARDKDELDRLCEQARTEMKRRLR